MKINKTTFFVFLIWFLIVNLFTFKNFFWLSHGNIYYKNNAFTWALESFEKVDSLEGDYNKLNSNYRLDNYKNILENIEDCNEWKDCSLYYHNIWNTYFRASEQFSSQPSPTGEGVVTSEKEVLLEKSISSYLSALKINYDEQTEKNLEYVKQVLEKLKREEQEQSSSATGNGETSDKWEKNEDWIEKNSTKTEEYLDEEASKDWEEESPSSEESEQWEEDWLSESEKNTLEEYSEALEEWQKDFWKYYNKVYTESRNPVDEFESIFWNDQFFDNSLLDWRNEKKDW